MKKIAILLFVTLSLTPFAKAQVCDAQAMCIYNFCRMTEWPVSTKQGDFIIGVCGDSKIQTSLKKFMLNKYIGTQKIKIVIFSDVEDITPCHTLFIPLGKSCRIDEITARLNNFPCLLIGEKHGILNEGAAINFILRDDKLRFELNEANAEKQNLKISQNLVKMASL